MSIEGGGKHPSPAMVEFYINNYSLPTQQHNNKQYGVVIAAVYSSRHAVECRRGLPWSEETIGWYDETVGLFSTLCYTYDGEGVRADDDDEYHDDDIEFER
jgi:hypothetical protein